jgi:Ca2+-binding EF-hand superfamily protein
LGWFKEFYVELVYNWFTFFLLPVASLRISLVSLVTSKQFVQFIHMDSLDLSRNPFSIQAANEIFMLYQHHVKEEPGMLRMEDLRTIKVGERRYNFTSAFLSQLFNILPTYGGQLDFALFCTVVLPLRFIDAPQATHFFFQFLDYDDDGLVSPLDITYFYQSIAADLGNDAPDFNSYLSEIFDTCQCPGEGFTEKELFASGEQENVIRLLVDLGSSKSGGSE